VSVPSELRANDYAEFRILLEREVGIVLGEGKQYLIDSRLYRLMAENNLTSLSDLVKKMTTVGGQTLKGQVIDAMTTNETFWFRDTYPFTALLDRIFPEFDQGAAPAVKIWSAACSSGQEAYSISMTTDEYLETHRGSRLRVSITGTDISDQILRKAREGIYDPFSVTRGITKERFDRYFVRQTDGSWAIRNEVKTRASFQKLNLLQSFAALGRFQVIFCRNVLIYFSAETKTDILNRMADCLVPNGYLILGSSESATQFAKRYQMLRLPKGGVIYQRKD